MTRDEILNMPAGKEMDALIAGKVMGWTRPPSGKGWNVTTVFKRETPDGENLQVAWASDDVVKFSTDISAAWEVVEKFAHQACNKLARKQGFSYWQLNAYPDNGWACRIGGISAYAETAPLAICRAALLAVMEEK